MLIRANSNDCHRGIPRKRFGVSTGADSAIAQLRKYRAPRMVSELSTSNRLEPIRWGFTLVEMLVATTLVILIMTIFTEVFQMASGSMTLQRTIAENDQQVRTFTTVIRGDLQKRTFRNVVPFFPREDYTLNEGSFAGRDGYFYISENSLDHGADTVLQFTADANIITESVDQTPYYGRAALLALLNAVPNQMENDDGQIIQNSASSSSAAEISYFVRAGILYRRVVLLRQPLSTLGNSNATDVIQPRTQAGVPLLNAGTGLDYWALFDHAAFRSPSSVPANQVPVLLGMDANRSVLDNKRRDASDTPLGRSRFRFGFDNSFLPNGSLTATNGRSREYFGPNNEFFLGRFTHEETSHSNFKYPCAGSAVAGGNPFRSDAVLLDADTDGIVDLFAGGSRAGQDILLTNVHSFQVEVYDRRLSAFVRVGHSLTNAAGQAGDFHIGRKLNQNYAPLGSTAGHSFDTWHPWYDQDGAGVGDTLPSPAPPSPPNQNYYGNAMLQDNPPYRPMTFDPAPTPTSAPNPANPGNRPFIWAPNVDYQPGDIVFPPTEDTNYDGVLDADGQFGYANDGLIDRPGPNVLVPAQPYGRVYYYRCIRARLDPANAAQLSNSYNDQPQWSSSVGLKVYHNQTANPQAQNMAIWEPVYNLRPISSIRMTVRFLHRGTNKLRQVTLIHSLSHQ